MASHFLGTLKPRLSISGTRFDECGWVAITTSLQVSGCYYRLAHKPRFYIRLESCSSSLWQSAFVPVAIAITTIIVRALCSNILKLLM
jgi:hypothetical protein